MKIRGTALPAIDTFEFVDDKLILRLVKLMDPIGRLVGVMKLKYGPVPEDHTAQVGGLQPSLNMAPR